MTSMNMKTVDRAGTRVHFQGLDSLRFFAALWVVMGHGAVPPLTEGHDASNPVAWALNGFWTAAISGPAAVIVFFVISGFCIHLPYEQGKTFRLGEFLARRWLRIMIPMVAALWLFRNLPWVTPSMDLLDGIPAWSLVCEMIYYGLYPVLYWLSSRVSFKRQFQVAFVLAFVFACTKPLSNVNYPAWGYSLDWVIGLPCWLLGVLLAQKVSVGGDRTNRPLASHIWLLRITAVGIGAVTHNLALQQVLGQHMTLNFFALFCFVWVGKEITFYRADRQPWALFEWAGSWSYSLYLVHCIAFVVYHQLPVPNLGHLANWGLRMIWVLCFALAFYYLVERPAHRLARYVSGNRGMSPASAAGACSSKSKIKE
jgi:peptidoglycan/LPS O-acetylase OafA/YrhL